MTTCELIVEEEEELEKAAKLAYSEGGTGEGEDKGEEEEEEETVRRISRVMDQKKTRPDDVST